MSLDIIESRLKEYLPSTKQEELNALKEICQEIALSGLARSNFFKVGAFQGGTCLRILFSLKRFSEDLDFVLIQPDKSFSWESYLKAIELEFNSFGLELQVIDRSNTETVVKRAFLKSNSFGKVLELKHEFLPSDKQSIKIKLEIDVIPPNGSYYETQYLDFPYPFSILSQDLPSLFSTKCHAILCRKYDKGRDWFDFLWYISRKISVNFQLLSNALFQTGPFKGHKEKIDKNWLTTHLNHKIDEINWNDTRLDIESFLKPDEKKIIENWNKDLFHNMVKKLGVYLG